MDVLNQTVLDLGVSIKALESRVAAHEAQQEASIAVLGQTIGQLQANGDVPAAIASLAALKESIDSFEAPTA